MKRIALFLAACTMVIHVTAQVSFGKPEKINKDWKFILSDSDNYQQVKFDDKKWKTVQIPHDWSVKEQLSTTLASCMGYLPGGVGWYRKSINIPASRQGEKVYLYFEGVYNRSEVYFNGRLLGKRPNGYISFMYDATPYVEYGKENVIAVRVDHSQSADSRWYTGSGIYRDVWLVYANQVHIAQWGVFAYPKNITPKQGLLAVEVEINNNSDVNSKLVISNELIAPEGHVVAKASKKLTVAANQNGKITYDFKVRNPELWDLDKPVLYTLKTTVLENGKVIDESSLKTGFRTYTFDPNKGFALNGVWMKVKGVCLHHDSGVLGAESYKDVWKRRLLTLKKLGVNAVRTSHNPQAAHLYELCDELGMLLMNEAFDEWEFPKRKWLTGWNHGTPGFQGSYDFFEEWGERDLKDMVLRDRNHIAIFAWSIGNEVDYPNDPYSHPVLDGGSETGFTQPIFGGYKKNAPDAMRLGAIAKRLAAIVRECDPSRPVTAGLAGVTMSNETEYPETLDIAGYNYTESRYEIDHKKYPDRVIYGSENRHDLNAWKHVQDKEYIFGQFLWTGIDYLGESGRWPSRGFYSGLLDFGGFIKPRGYFRQSLWSNDPMVYLGTYPTPGSGSGSNMLDVWSQLEDSNKNKKKEERPSMDAWPLWNYSDGQSIRVVCYSNTAKAKLLLNGQQIGEVKDYDDKTGISYWDIPYQAGKLEVIGMNADGKEVVRDAIRSSGRPYALTAKLVEHDICKKDGIAHVVVQVVDEQEIPVFLADNEVTCLIAGPGRLLGLEASNNSDMSDYTDNKHRVFNGRILAYVQATGEAGEVKMKFTSPLLEAAELSIQLK
ncbi:MAG: Beta-galactosidase [Bacteroidetes bacterium ADurb.Bin174]|nr:MAG: Beta-galactosidase [Bacteroidetes bacterium ADurb.Bin174]